LHEVRQPSQGMILFSQRWSRRIYKFCNHGRQKRKMK